VNQRIQELYKQAHVTETKQVRKGGWDNDREPFEYSSVTTTVFNPEKFAQLIVKECMRQVEEQYLPVLEDQVMMKDTHWDGYVQCGVDSYVAIREHFFGIEE
jgi:hypothetical protein